MQIIEKNMCSGCSACFNKCPKNAISMIEDENGFKYPVINQEICINCGICKKTCPVLKESKMQNTPLAYACYNKDEKVRLNSSSGGIFTLIAEFIIKKGGVVFGAAFDKEFNLQHIYVDNIEELSKLRTSKYFQSNIKNTYQEAKRFLEEGRFVLFTGTPCQVEGLKSYLSKDYGNLYTQDIICHGVPSPKVWKKYLEHRNKKDGEIPKNINFRNKDLGWNTYSLKFEYEKNTYSNTQYKDKYMQAFLSNVCLRESCYNCSFKKYNRISDITLADFWGIKNIDSSFNDDKGISLVITSSKKGELLLKEISDLCIIKKVDLDSSIKYNKSYISSVKINKNRKKFFKNLDKYDFDKLVRKYVIMPNLSKKFIRKGKNLVKKIIGK